MKSNFIIRDLIQNKSFRAENPNLELEPNPHDENLSKGDEIKISALLQSFEKIITSLVNSNSNKATESSKHGKIISNRSDQVDLRDRFVIIDLPDFDDREVDEENFKLGLENSVPKF
jgi:hypothetical protein